MPPLSNLSVPNPFGVMVTNVAGWLDCSVVLAGSQAGALGVLNCEASPSAPEIDDAIARISKLANATFGVKARSVAPLTLDLLSRLPEKAAWVVLTAASEERLRSLIVTAHVGAREALVEVCSVDDARVAVASGADGLIAKGHEAGGSVGEESTFVLLQRLLSEFGVPVWAHGGIGFHSAAACYVAGAAGVVLDNQLLLTRESSLPREPRTAVERMEGDETVCLGAEIGESYRLYRRPGMNGADRLQRLDHELSALAAADARLEAWEREIDQLLGWRHRESDIWPLGQDAAFAAPLAKRYQTVGGIVRALRTAVATHAELACAQNALNSGGGLAKRHGTEFPIVQGPMTRVSDTAEFAQAVAQNGALPMLALALLRAPELRELLARTRKKLGGRPWGIGILGFVPADLRQEQLEVVREFRPPFAIIAGGRPDQAASLERDGISSYLHVPAPALLKMFLQDGARGFIFEGRECGGHVGPRTSFVLWETMIDALLDAAAGGVRADELRIVFAGGIHDARSAAMVAAMAAPLVEAGAHIGLLMGTAYLFTQEAVETGAIVEGFQKEALSCRRTVLLETGPGHAIRCTENPYYQTFLESKRRLQAEKKSGEEIRASLEESNLGRLRLASKGIARISSDEPSARYAKVAEETQRREGMYMIGQVAAMHDSVVSMRDLHEAVTRGSVDWLRRRAAAPSFARTPRPQPRPDPCQIAIIGMNCLLPQAPDVRRFWANLIHKVDAITDVPRERFDIDLYFDPDRKTRDRVYSRWGGFLGEVPFDPIRYGIPPASLSSIDPMQLLSLVVVDRALRDAGYRERDFPHERTSVIFGLSGGLGDLGIKYAVRAALPGLLQSPPEALLERLPEWTEDSFAGILLNVAAGRVANRFNLGGVNFTVDAACASSLAAVYLAVRELNGHTSDMVVVGGVDTVQSPFGFLCFSKSQALSPRGRCRTFDADADGIAISEGLTVLVLKRLEDAQRDGDRVYAVIQGVGGSSDGRGRSMTAPRLEGQVLALQRAYQQAGVRPSTVGLVEAHGTGTAAGDAAELAALSQVFQGDGASPQSCIVGSVKSFIGHTKSAAGVTGLMRAALALHHKVLPPTLHVERPNPKLLEPASPFFINTEPVPWIGSEVTRRAGVSSFGFGGTNFHVVLEEYPAASPERMGLEDWPAELFVWRAGSAADLRTALEGFTETLDAFSAESQPALCDLAFTVSRNRSAEHGAWLAIVAESISDLKEKVSSARKNLLQGDTARGGPAPGVYFSPSISGHPSKGKVAFLFPGQGSQKPHMFRDLAVHFADIRQSLEQAEAFLAGRFAKRLSAYIYPPATFSPEEETRAAAEITDTVVAQPALGAVEAGLCRLLRRMGVLPDMVAGHSYGEYVALHAAGVLSEAALFDLSEQRGRAIKESQRSNPGAMAAVQAGAETVSRELTSMDGISLANQNAPLQTVISGPTEKVEAAMARLEASGISTRRLPVACAFHSPLMEAASEQLQAALAAHRFSHPRTPVYSNALGQRYPEDPEQIAKLLVDHLAAPVRFVDEVQSMYRDGARTFLEVGPKGVLSGLVRQILSGKDVQVLQMDGEHGLEHFLRVLGQLIAGGMEIEFDELFRNRELRVLDLDGAKGHLSDGPTWLVNGSRAFPANQKPALQPPLPLTEGAQNALAETSFSTAEVPGNTPAPSKFPSMLPIRPDIALPAGLPGQHEQADGVMLQFQQLMSQFLQTQAAIMTSYLGGQSAAAEPLVEGAHPDAAVALPPRNGAERAEEKTAATPAQEVTSPVSQPAPVTASIGADQSGAAGRRDFADELRKLASERTGYPMEMLDPDASIEADLGIDSIKRVEILSAFQRMCQPAEQKHLQSIMDRLTSAPTLRQMADRIRAALPEGERGRDSGAEQPPAGPAGLAVRDFAAELRKIASERTGYPVEMLDLNAAIEADLGIDSIKRVEILSAFQRLCTPTEQGLVQATMERLTSARTLQEMADKIAATLQTLPAVSPSPELQAPGTVARCVLTAIEKRRLAGGPYFYRGRISLVTDDETGIAAGLAEELDGVGEKALLLRHSPDATLAVNGVFSADLTDPAAIDQVIQTVRKQYGPVGALIHLLPLRAGHEAAPQSLAEARELAGIDIKSFYLLARAAEADLTAAGEKAGALVAVGTARGGAFGLGVPEGIQPSHFGVADFAKTLAAEFAGVRVKIVDLDPSDPVGIMRQKLVDELTSSDDTLQVGLPGDKRLTIMPQLAPLSSGGKRRIGSDWVFLLTGGARGITAEIAMTLARQRKPILILAGLSSLPAEPEAIETASITEPAALRATLAERLRAEQQQVKPADVEAACQRLLKNREIRETMQALRASAKDVEYHSLDVRDEGALGKLVEDIYRRHGRLDVVIHGAGIIEDKLIRDKTPDSFDRVVGTKADSIFALSRLLRRDLKALVLMSSVSAVFGNRGQADYSAANGIMNGFAVRLSRDWHAQVVAMNWGPWDSADSGRPTGMVSAETRKQFLARGIHLIPPAAGAEAVLSEIEAGGTSEPVVVLGNGPWTDAAVSGTRLSRVSTQGILS